MISVNEAFRLIEDNVQLLGSEEIKLESALGRVLSTDIVSPISMPPFRQSAMDGYAINRLTDEETLFSVVGEVKAGDDASHVSIGHGEAIRIFTGAMVPNDAICVVRQEAVTLIDGNIAVNEYHKNMQNIRPQGEQVQSGQTAAKKGTVLNPGVLSYLTGLGILSVSCSRLPKVSIIVTGNELLKPGMELIPGKIYESNGIMLKSLLKINDFEANYIHVTDDYEATKKAISNAMSESDLLLLSGGISVGDYDFVGKALEELGTNCLFYKIRQKPGKPIYFGKNEACHIFALPGNPASAYTCFHLYVLHALEIMQGRLNPYLPVLSGKSANSYSKKAGLTHLLKASVDQRGIQILGAQSSAMLSAYTEANALLIIPEDTEVVTEGDELRYYLIN